MQIINGYPAFWGKSLEEQADTIARATEESGDDAAAASEPEKPPCDAVHMDIMTQTAGMPGASEEVPAAAERAKAIQAYRNAMKRPGMIPMQHEPSGNQ